MGYEALEISDWRSVTGSDWIFKLEPQRSISDFTGRFCARFVVRMLLALYYLYMVFIRNKKLYFEYTMVIFTF